MVTLPAKLVKDAGLYTGQALKVSIVKDAIVIKPQEKPAKKIPITQMKTGVISIPNFDFEQSMKWIEESHYDR